MNQKQQQQALHDFYHGKGEESPSQIKMLADGISAYKDLYDVKTQSIIIKKNGKRTNMNKNELTLKQLLSRTEFLTFTAGDEITTADLVKKHRRSSTELVSGRQLFGMAERGMRDYRKALAFTKDKWDEKKMQPLESGTSIEDVIEYVRQRMYLHSHVKVGDDEDGSNDKDDDDNVKHNNSKIHNDENDDHDSQSEDYKPNTQDIEDDNNIDDDGDDYKEEFLGSDDEDDEVPHEWMFNSYMAYIMWGPFAKEEKKLSLFLLGK